MGYEKASVECLIEAFTRLDTLRLRVSVEQLAAITVKADNILYNPKGYKLNVDENPLYKGYDLTDVLSTAPGLIVTDDSIRSFEKQIRTVYIDERPVKFSGETLMQYLRSRRAENVRTIEVVTDSGVEEEASVMGGAVLRITTNRLDDGGFGTARAGTMLGRTRKTLFTNASADMRAGKFSLYTFLTLPGYFNTRSRSENFTENRLTADIGRGISRPDMASLNPNTDYTSADFYTKGNPNLRSSSRNYATLRTVWFNRYNLSVSYGFTDRAAAGIVRMDEAGILCSIPENLASHRYVQANFGSSWNLFRRIVLNGDLSYRHEENRYDGQRYIYNTAEVMVNILYNLPHGFRAGAGLIWSSLSGSGNSLTEAARPMLSCSLNKALLQRRLTLGLSCRNILSSGRSRTTSDEPAFYRSSRSLLSGPAVSFTASYNFKWGNKRVKIQHAAAEDSENPRL